LFRKNHPAVGAGIHAQISASPYVFSRIFTKGKYTDKVVMGLDLPLGKKEITVGTIFKNGSKVYDVYSNTEAIVIGGKVNIQTNYTILLLEEKK
jgi:alpha-amylase